MNAEIKAKWVAALRSGEYKQGKDNLFGNDKYCCLGVLCDLHAKETGRVWEYGYTCRKYCNCTQLTPTEVVNWANLGEANPVINVGGVFRRLAGINDDGTTFEEIAKIIEEQL